MLRWPVVKPVSNVSEVGTAPPRPPAGIRSGPKTADLEGCPAPEAGLKNAPECPVLALFAVQPLISGTIGC